MYSRDLQAEQVCEEEDTTSYDASLLGHSSSLHGANTLRQGLDHVPARDWRYLEFRHKQPAGEGEPYTTDGFFTGNGRQNTAHSAELSKP